MSGLDNTSFTVRTATGTTDTLTNNDSIVIYTNSAARTVNLPSTAVVQPGRRYAVINGGGATAITITPASGQNIDGSATLALAATATTRAEFISDGTNWFTISSHA